VIDVWLGSPDESAYTHVMTAAKKQNLVSVEDYLAGELVSPIKHEYLGGVVYAMAGARNRHNLIATNALVVLGSRLRGQPCRPYNSDTKIRIHLSTQFRFYYPDASVVCRPNPADDSYQDEPVVLVEVLSAKTRRIDEGEKKDAYLTIPSLAVYLLVEQEMPAIVAFRRTEHGFVREVYEGLDAVVRLGEIGTALPLAEVYEAVEFRPEPAEEEIG
jgi:Uma2 family endonuclease